VLVRLRARPAHCTIFVLDHGPGIPDEFRARIFEPFAQANATDLPRSAAAACSA
jgi:signal transduction histidine kinase